MADDPVKKSEEIQILKVNNPDYIQKELWPLIVNLADILKTPGTSAHSLMTFLLYGVMNNVIELWAAIKENKCLGFVVFQIMNAPYYSMGARNYTYVEKTEDKKEIIEQFRAKFADFLKRNNLKYFMYHSKNQRLGDKWKTELSEYGLNVKNEEYLFIGTRKIGGN